MHKLSLSLSLITDFFFPFSHLLCSPILGEYWDISGTGFQECFFYLRLYWFGRAAITKYHILQGLSNKFSHSSGAQKSKITVLVDLVASKASLIGMQVANLLLCPHMVFCLSTCSCYLFVCLSLLFLQAYHQMGLGPRPCLQIQSHSEVFGLRASIYEFGGTQFSA